MYTFVILYSLVPAIELVCCRPKICDDLWHIVTIRTVTPESVVINDFALKQGLRRC